MKYKLIKGQWVCALEGLAQIISIHDFYVEEFSPEYMEGKKKPGEYSHSICVYKLLCDYNGKIRKRSLVQYSNIDMCEPVTGEYQILLDKVKTQNLTEFERHQNLTVKKTPVPPVKLFFRYQNADLASLNAGINAINHELDKPFIFPDFKKAVENHGLDIDFSKANKKPDLRPPDFYISLYIDNFVVRNKQTLFTKVEGIISDWQAAVVNQA